MSSIRRLCASNPVSSTKTMSHEDRVLVFSIVMELLIGRRWRDMNDLSFGVEIQVHMLACCQRLQHGALDEIMNMWVLDAAAGTIHCPESRRNVSIGKHDIE